MNLWKWRRYGVDPCETMNQQRAAGDENEYKWQRWTSFFCASSSYLSTCLLLLPARQPPSSVCPLSSCPGYVWIQWKGATTVDWRRIIDPMKEAPSSLRSPSDWAKAADDCYGNEQTVISIINRRTTTTAAAAANGDQLPQQRLQQQMHVFLCHAQTNRLHGIEERLPVRQEDGK